MSCRAAFLWVVLSILPVANAGEPPGGYFKEPAWGFKIKVPKDWQQTAVAGDTPWIASKHLGKRELEWQDSSHWRLERPEMWVVGFPHNQGDVANPHAGYRDYITRESGFFEITDEYEMLPEKQTTVGDAKVTIFEVKGKTKKAPRHMIAWVYHFDDIDFAVQFKVFENHYDGYEASFRGCFKSFRRIDRTKALGGSASAGGSKITSRDAVAALPADQRVRAFKEAVQAHFRAAIDALPEGWESKESKNFLLLTNADSKFVRAATTHADAVVAHLDKFFGKPEMDYRPPFILRIFATDDQRRAYGDDKEASALVRDIAIYSGKGYVKDNSLGDLNQGLWERWMEDRHPGLAGALPGWIKTGVEKYMNMMRSKGRRVDFAHENYDRDQIRLDIKAGNYLPLRALLSSGFVELAVEKHLEGHVIERQQRVVVMWLLREGNRGRYKNLIRDLIVAIDEGLEAGKGDQIHAEAWKRTLGKWSDKDWKKLTKSWLEFAK